MAHQTSVKDNLFRLRSLRAALNLEATDRRHLSPYVAPGCSAFSIIKDETGIKARSARELLPLFDDYVEVQRRLMYLVLGRSAT